ncbi:hypothetical protein GC105_03195 [Alkalibaculum sp. M08DMB]|uniref:Flagellar hook-length control protein-like C-terminal domain-containing protein n=1 Tax=Alkalibaculum sporogenes TaxID=2655001 RepID=A0A6A7K5T6_9FIRM|nr:flagellar hook-length control protein FliK [Alkalibaculum sporogenes]MPW24796.1 hypothetical protein [Alkalibaculum sporogenes]
MKVENAQVSTKMGKMNNKSSKSNEHQDVFSVVLANKLNNRGKENHKTDNSIIRLSIKGDMTTEAVPEEIILKEAILEEKSDDKIVIPELISDINSEDKKINIMSAILHIPIYHDKTINNTNVEINDGLLDESILNYQRSDVLSQFTTEAMSELEEENSLFINKNIVENEKDLVINKSIVETTSIHEKKILEFKPNSNLGEKKLNIPILQNDNIKEDETVLQTVKSMGEKLNYYKNEVIKTSDRATVIEKADMNLNVKEFQSIKSSSEIIIKEEVLSHDNLHKVNDSIIKLMETSAQGDANVMKVKLHPEELGSVNVVLKIEEGKLIARILVDNDQIKQMFGNKINELIDNLAKQNINIEKIDIDFNGSQNRDSSGQSGQDNKDLFREFILDDELLETSIAKDNGTDISEISILA